MFYSSVGPTGQSHQNLLTTTNTSAPPSAKSSVAVSIEHTYVPIGRYIGCSKCRACERALLFPLRGEVKLKCKVCRIRVHESCKHLVPNDCKLTFRYVSTFLHDAVLKSNKKKWYPSTTPSPQESDKHEKTSPMTGGDTSGSGSDKRGIAASLSTPLKMLRRHAHSIVGNEKTWEDVALRENHVIVGRVLSRGRFGDVHMGNYHGDVAIKFVDMSHIGTQQQRYRTFVSEMASYKNTRHEHLALFLGFFIPVHDEKYAIVTNFYQYKDGKRKSLDMFIKDNRGTSTLPLLLTFAQQICQAMSYLHSKNIINRDLRSRNILLDKETKVVVADFGLLNMERLTHPKGIYGMRVPKNWLCYIAPEVAWSIYVYKNEFVPDYLQFSRQSDVFAFGTIWYEMIFGHLPNGHDSWEAQFYERGCGMKPNLKLNKNQRAQYQVSNEKVIEILLACWSSRLHDRPSFSQLSVDVGELVRKNSKPKKQDATLACNFSKHESSI